MPQLLALSLALAFVVYLSSSAWAAESSKPVAIVFGKPVHESDLVPAPGTPVTDPAARERARAEKLRAHVWSAAFADYARTRKIEASEAEIASHIRAHERVQKEGRIEREKQRAGLLAELKSPGLKDARRQRIEQHLKSLDYLHEHDARRDAELADPARRKIWEQSGRRVAEVWVKSWKLNQALYREFGGRLIFQQAGWEPIDAYRKLIEQTEKNKAFVIHDPTLREAVYAYFKHKGTSKNSFFPLAN
jgi:hypothetical protein